MTAVVVTSIFAALVGLAFVAWRRYLWAAEDVGLDKSDVCPYSLTDAFGDNHLVNVPHQKDVQWLTDIFSRSAKRFPNLTALQIPHTGESLTYAELDGRAENIADAISPFLSGPDQVVAVAMSQDNWQIVAAHLGILKAGGTVMFLDTTLPEDLISHMLDDAQPVVILTRGVRSFRHLPTLDVMNLPEALPRRKPATWLDDPTQRLATVFYTSGTTGMPKGVECPHAGYVNLALSYAVYFDLLPGMDATSLTSSLGYDGSISEMYSAWVSGCAVVMLTKDEIRSGPELVEILRGSEVTVLFCPPVLLTTLTADPANDLPYPICRYIVPAGEAFPSALVEPWTRNRRQIINTYGPTEASTDTSRQSLKPGEPITIGSPFANVTYVILEIDGLQPLPHGEAGELCIGGVHVARGYRNLPEQTAAKFIVHPKFGRLYRTGDKCTIDAKTHRVHFQGRIDAQLKVRGHRVEAQAVEDILQTQFREIEAAVLDYQNEALVAFVAAPSIREREFSVVTPAPAEWASRVTASLARQLPEPSVPSRIFLVEKFEMKEVSGKIDRKSLPDLSHVLRKAPPSADVFTDSNANVCETEFDPENPSDPDCDEVLGICRSVFETPIGPDDTFADAGGHSIMIARLAYKLRAAGRPVPVRALLSDCNTARKIAEAWPRVETAKNSESERAAEDVSPECLGETDKPGSDLLSVRWFTFLQVLFALLLYVPGLVAFLTVFGEVDDGSFLMTTDLPGVIIVSLLFYVFVLVTPFLFLYWAKAIKFFLVRGANQEKYLKPGVYPKWSKMHLRVWCIQRLETSVLLPFDALYRSAPLRAFVLRQLGADIGENLQCARDAYLSGPLDLVSIGSNVAIQSGAYIQTTSWSGQAFRIGPVRLDDGCKISMRAAVANNVTVGRGTWITPFTPVLESVGEYEVWEGSPARLAGRCTRLNRTAKACEYKQPIWLLETANVLMQVFISFWLNGVPIALIFWLCRGLILNGDPMYVVHLESATLFEIVGPLILCGFVTTWLTIVVTSILACLFIRFTAASPGIYPSRGLRGALLMYRMNKMNTIQRQWTWTVTGQYLRALAGVRFPRVGASECDVMFNLVPETASAASKVFWSSGSFTNMLDYGAEYFTLRRLDMPKNFFTGNNCVAEYGQFPENFLLGVSTPCSEIDYRRQMWSRPGEPITVAGNPPVRFPSTSSDEGETRPAFSLFLARVLMNDFLGIGLLPITEGILFAIFFVALSEVGAGAIVGALTALLLTEASLVLLCVTVKEVLVGKWGIDNKTPFWSLRHFAYFFTQDCFFVWCREPLRLFAGTTVANYILRMFGCEIGRRTLVTQPMQCFDWNAVSFGDDCYVDGFLQLHTFEDMTLKAKRTHILDGSAVNVGATVMGGAVIGPASNLLPLSLVLKEFHLPTATYEGSPAEPVGGSVAVPESGIDLDRTDDIRPRYVDNTDWLKVAAIILVTIDHFGYFFVDNDRWWGVFGRMAAPAFFFLIGYARTQNVPMHWIGIGIVLTMLDSSNNDWRWVAPNILLSFAAIRLVRPYAEKLLEKYGWIAFVAIAAVLFLSVPAAAPVFDYGAEGWLWALFGLTQRMYVEKHIGATPEAAESRPHLLSRTITSAGLLRIAACILAAFVYVSQEQIEFKFNFAQSRVFIAGLIVLAISMCLFWRGASRFQPPPMLARPVQFVGRHTLAIYAITLAAFEIIVKIFPDLAA